MNHDKSAPMRFSSTFNPHRCLSGERLLLKQTKGSKGRRLLSISSILFCHQFEAPMNPNRIVINENHDLIWAVSDLETTF